MLILTRRLGETLVIGDDIRVTVLDVSGNQVRLGVTAPVVVPVHREEVYLRIKTEEAQREIDDEIKSAQKQQPRIMYRSSRM